jgi:hypothetical protein
LLSFVTQKAKENIVPSSVDIQIDEIDNLKYKAIKVGSVFSIKRKIKD